MAVSPGPEELLELADEAEDEVTQAIYRIGAAVCERLDEVDGSLALLISSLSGELSVQANGGDDDEY